jgi:DNA-binding NarL/FixJ family response regulator
MEVVGRATDGAAAVEEILRLQPDVAVLDISMPRLTGVEVAERLTAANVRTAILLYTGTPDAPLWRAGIAAGARGYALKTRSLDDLVRAVETVAAGAVFVDPEAAQQAGSGGATAGLPQLSERERQVLALLADGASYADAGRELHISPDTVRVHVRRAMDRLEADTRTEAVAKAIRLSLLD